MEPADMPQALCAWYRTARRDLPWRRTRDPYAIWVSEVMLQQTRVETVVPYYLSFTGKWPSVRLLAAAEEYDVLKAWEGLGYYSRARNLLKGAKHVVQCHGGKVPGDVKALMKVPGVGPYTAGAILSIAFDYPAPAVDANAERVFTRLLALDPPAGSAELKSAVAASVETAMRGCSPREFSQAVMELGALVCLPGTPRCADCPVRGHCAALSLGRTRDFPTRTPPPEKRVVRLAVAIAADAAGRLLVHRREPGGLLGGLWEFPAFEAGSDPEAAVRRGLKELGLTTGAMRPAGDARRGFTHLIWDMRGFFVETKEAPLPRGWAWQKPEALDDLAWPSAMKPWRERARADAAKHAIT